MIKIFAIFGILACFLAGYFLHSWVSKPVETVVEKVSIVRDTIIPPPITQWVKGDTKYDTVSVIDTVTRVVSLDTVSSRIFTNTLVRDLDSVSVSVQVFGREDLGSRWKYQFNPDHIITKEITKTVVKSEPIRFGIQATGGIDIKGRPNVVVGLGINVSFDILKLWR